MYKLTYRYGNDINDKSIFTKEFHNESNMRTYIEVGKDKELTVIGIEEVKNTLIGYARVSTEGQNLDRQIDMLVNYGVDKRNIYQEKMTGTKSDREQLNKMIEELQENDIVVIADLTRGIKKYQGLIKYHW